MKKTKHEENIAGIAASIQDGVSRAEHDSAYHAYEQARHLASSGDGWVGFIDSTIVAAQALTAYERRYRSAYLDFDWYSAVDHIAGKWAENPLRTDWAAVIREYALAERLATKQRIAKDKEII